MSSPVLRVPTQRNVCVCGGEGGNGRATPCKEGGLSALIIGIGVLVCMPLHYQTTPWALTAWGSKLSNFPVTVGACPQTKISLNPCTYSILCPCQRWSLQGKKIGRQTKSNIVVCTVYHGVSMTRESPGLVKCHSCNLPIYFYHVWMVEEELLALPKLIDD